MKKKHLNVAGLLIKVQIISFLICKWRRCYFWKVVQEI